MTDVGGSDEIVLENLSPVRGFLLVCNSFNERRWHHVVTVGVEKLKLIKLDGQLWQNNLLIGPTHLITNLPTIADLRFSCIKHLTAKLFSSCGRPTNTNYF